MYEKTLLVEDKNESNAISGRYFGEVDRSSVIKTG
jgi:type IV secretory pathway protease TraF